MTTLTAAQMANKLRGDDRMVVTAPDPTANTKMLVFSAKPADGVQLRFAGTAYPGTPATAKGTAAAHTGVPATDAAAFYSSVPGTDVSVAVDPNVAAVGGVSPYVRTGWFSIMGGGGIIRKLCYVDYYGTPLTAAGVPIINQDATTKVWTRGSVATDAANAETTALSAVGSSVANGTQPGLPVGVYIIPSTGSSSYAPYPGWTAQQ